jgi:hypothetical protein
MRALHSRMRTKWVLPYASLLPGTKVCFPDVLNPERSLESASSRAKIRNFYNTFRELKNDFDRGATMQNAVINEKILHAMREPPNFRTLLYAREISSTAH